MDFVFKMMNSVPVPHPPMVETTDGSVRETARSVRETARNGIQFAFKMMSFVLE